MHGLQPLNRGENLEKFQYLDKIIAKVETNIDRIKISTYNKNFNNILKYLQNRYIFLHHTPMGASEAKSPSARKVAIWNFESYGSSKIQLKKYDAGGALHGGETQYSWCTLTLFQPDNEIQLDFLKFFEEIFAPNVIEKEVSLSEIEFAVDFYPVKENFLVQIEHELKDGMTLKYGRSQSVKKVSFKNRKSTIYAGNDGHIRKGAKGIRIYTKPIDKPREFVRVELQANKRMLKKFGIGIQSLPVSPHLICPFDYLHYRDKPKKDRKKMFKAMEKKICNNDKLKVNLQKGKCPREKVRWHVINSIIKDGNDTNAISCEIDTFNPDVS